MSVVEGWLGICVVEVLKVVTVGFVVDFDSGRLGFVGGWLGICVVGVLKVVTVGFVVDFDNGRLGLSVVEGCLGIIVIWGLIVVTTGSSVILGGQGFDIVH